MAQSNETTIEQVNLAIARFMGMEGTDDFIRQNYQYHRRWELLMPVVAKIETPELDKQGRIVRAAADVKIYYKACKIRYEPDEESGDSNNETIIQTQGETKIEAVYKAVYQFIVWLNQQKQDDL